ncbi:MAG: hypothetical protein JXB14_07535 [Candidatus Altiarchaeota archaeon]|nr:hypothetical protein [Candidatus Altiarchaeota archaeon]
MPARKPRLEPQRQGLLFGGEEIITPKSKKDFSPHGLAKMLQRRRLISARVARRAARPGGPKTTNVVHEVRDSFARMDRYPAVNIVALADFLSSRKVDRFKRPSTYEVAGRKIETEKLDPSIIFDALFQQPNILRTRTEEDRRFVNSTARKELENIVGWMNRQLRSRAIRRALAPSPGVRAMRDQLHRTQRPV